MQTYQDSGATATVAFQCETCKAGLEVPVPLGFAGLLSTVCPACGQHLEATLALPSDARALAQSQAAHPHPHSKSPSSSSSSSVSSTPAQRGLMANGAQAQHPAFHREVASDAAAIMETWGSGALDAKRRKKRRDKSLANLNTASQEREKREKKGKKKRATETDTWEDEIIETEEDKFDPFMQRLRSPAHDLHCDCPGLISNASEPVLCPAHGERCRGNELWKVCLRCRLVMCAYCFEETHRSSALSNCRSLPHSVMVQARRLYRGDTVSRMACVEIVERADAFFAPKEIVRQVVNMATKARANFGDKYELSFLEFLEAFSADARTQAAATAGEVSPEMEIAAAADRFHHLGWCGRRLFDFQLRWSKGTDDVQFLWAGWIHHIEARFGPSLAFYFVFFRWTFLVNVMLSLLTVSFLIIPSLWQAIFRTFRPIALLLGHGAEDTFFFFGGYLNVYRNGWHMDIAWVIVQAAILFVSIVAVMLSIDAESLSQEEDNNVHSTQQFCAALFGGLDHSATSVAAQIVRQRALVTNLEVIQRSRTLGVFAPRTRRPCCTGICDPWYAWCLGGLVFIAANAYAIYLLTQWDQDTVIPDYASKFRFLVVPAIITVSKSVGPAVLRFTTMREFQALYFTFDQRMTSYFWRLLLLRLCYVVVIVITIFGADHERNVPSRTHDVAVAMGICTCTLDGGNGLNSGSACSDNSQFDCRCAETEIGMMFYRLIVVDMLLETFWALVWSPIRFCLLRCCCRCMRNQVEGSTRATARDVVPTGKGKATDKNGQQQQQPRTSTAASPHARKPSTSPAHSNGASVGAGAMKDHAALSAPGKAEDQHMESFEDRMARRHWRKEFDPLVHIVDLIYRQMLIWSGISYSPVLPIAAAIWSFLLFYVRTLELFRFRHEPQYLYSAAKQRATVRMSMVLVILVCFIPITYFVTRPTACGPFYYTWASSESIGDAFNARINGLPGGLRAVFDYFTNSLMLWLAVSVIGIYCLAVRRQVGLMRDRGDAVRCEIKLETRERARFIQELHIEVGLSDRRGKKLFETWVIALGAWGARYGRVLAQRGYGDLVKLCRHSDNQLMSLFRTMRVPPAVANAMVKSIQQCRIELINRAAKRR